MATIDRRGATVSAADPPVATNPNPDLAIKAPVLVATTGANIVLAGVQAIDGVTVGNSAERVLVKDQTDATTNGIYVASSGNWTRAVDAANNSQLAQGLIVDVTGGTANDGALYRLASANPVVLGASAITWQQLAIAVNPFTGDSGAGGAQGLVPRPPAGSAAAAKFLAAAGDFEQVPAMASGSSASFLGKMQFATYPWADVTAKPYNADPTGTVDASAAINAAIAAMNTAGGIVFIPPGTYKVTTPIVLSRAGNSVHIHGASTEGTVLTSAGADVAVITMGGPAFSSLHNLTVNGGGFGCANPAVTVNRGAQELYGVNIAGGRNGLLIDGSVHAANDCIIERVVTFGSYGPQCLVQGVVNGTRIRHCSFDLSGPFTQTPVGAVAAWRSGSYSQGNVATVGSDYIQCMVAGITGASAPTLANFGTNIIDGSVTWQLVGPVAALLQITSGVEELYVYYTDLSGTLLNCLEVDNGNPSFGGAPSLLFFEGCTFGGAVSDAVDLLAGGSLTIKGCEVIGGFSSGAAGIHLESGWTGPSAITGGNQFQTGGSTSYGVRIEGGTGNIVSANCFESGYATAVVAVAAGVSQFTVQGNACPGGGAIIVATGASDRYIITNNMLDGGTVTDGGSGSHKTVSGNV